MMPDGYGVANADDFLKWEEITDRLVGAHNYWLATSRPEGQPHVVPRWGVWLDDAFWYDGSPETRHVKNLGHSGPCVLHLEDGAAATIVEGVSARSEPIHGELGERLSIEFGRKYSDDGYSPRPTAWSDEIAGGMRRLSPVKVVAWTNFPRDVTRFTF